MRGAFVELGIVAGLLPATEDITINWLHGYVRRRHVPYEHAKHLRAVYAGSMTLRGISCPAVTTLKPSDNIFDRRWAKIFLAGKHPHRSNDQYSFRPRRVTAIVNLSRGPRLVITRLKAPGEQRRSVCLRMADRLVPAYQ